MALARLPLLSLPDLVVLPGMVVPVELDETAQGAVDADDFAVEVAVLETSVQGVLDDGLAFDVADVGAVLGLPADYTGLDGIHSVEVLVWATGTVIDSVRRRGYGVLNADRFFSNRAYFLLDRDGVVRWAHVEENPSLKRTNQEILAEVDRVT